MEGSVHALSAREKLFTLLKGEVDIPDPLVHFRTGVSTEEDIERRRQLFGSNHLERPKHDFVDLISSVVEHHPIIWLHIVLGFIKLFLVRHEADRAMTVGFCFVSIIAFMVIVVCSHVSAVDFDLEEAHNELIEVTRNSETHFIPSEELVVGDVFMLREGSRAPCNCAVVGGRVKTNSKTDSNRGNPAFLWRGVNVQSGACSVVAILVGGNMTYEEEEASFQNHHVKDNPLQHLQTVVLAMMLVVFVMLHLFSGQSDPGRLPVFIDILLCFSFLSPLNLLASRVSSSEDEDILKVRQLCIDKSVCLVKLQAVKAIGGVGMMSELTDTKDTEELVDFISRIPRAVGGPDPVRCSIALNTVSTRDDSTVEGALLSMLEEWFGVKAGSVREQWRGDVVSRRLFDTHKFTSCLLATRTDDGVVSGGVVFCMGAADVVLSRCGHMHSPIESDRLHPRPVDLSQDTDTLLADLIDPLSPSDRRQLDVKVLDYCRQGMTPIACAHRHISKQETEAILSGTSEGWDEGLDTDMTLDLIVALHNLTDPTTVVAHLKEFGLKLRMVTNDSLCTAVKVANDCHLHDGAIKLPTTAPMCITGAYFRTRFSPLISWYQSSQSVSSPPHMSLIAELKETQVLARATPEDKENLVHLLNETSLPTALVTKCARSGSTVKGVIHHHDLPSLLDQLIRCYTNTDNDQRAARFQLSVLVSVLLLALKRVALDVPSLLLLAVAVQLLCYCMRSQELAHPRRAIKRVAHFSEVTCMQRMAVEVCFELFLLSVVETVAPHLQQGLSTSHHASEMMFNTMVFCRLSGVIGLFIDSVHACASEIGTRIVAALLITSLTESYFLSLRMSTLELAVSSAVGSLTILVALFNRLLSSIDQSYDTEKTDKHRETKTAEETDVTDVARVSKAMVQLEKLVAGRRSRLVWEWIPFFIAALIPAYWLMALLSSALGM